MDYAIYHIITYSLLLAENDYILLSNIESKLHESNYTQST